MLDLDQPNGYGAVDRSGAIRRIVGLPEQVRDAWSLVEKLRLPDGYRGLQSVVVCGMGGSAIGGDLVRCLVEAEARVPILVVRGYQVPGFVGPDTLVLLSSFSGATEETLSAGEAARARGARVLALTTGGALADRGHREGFPVVQFAYPGRPRDAVGYSTFLILGVLARLGYVQAEELGIEKSWVILEAMAQELGPDVPTRANAAKQLARRLFGRLPVIYGGGLLAEVARRWKTQLNENAKHWAFFEQLPELNHNAVLGYRFPPALAGEIVVVVLSSERNPSRIRLREEITMELLAGAGAATERVWARGDTSLAHVLSATYHGDFVSYYLALLNEADPGDSTGLTLLKERLAHARG